MKRLIIFGATGSVGTSVLKVIKNNKDFKLVGFGYHANQAKAKKIKQEFNVKNVTKNSEFKVNLDFSKRQRDMLLAGGLLNYTKENAWVNKG